MGKYFSKANWNLVRVIRVALGLFFSVEAIRNEEYFWFIAAGLLFYQAYSNPVCADGSCEIPNEKK
jgi:hypothetical protein